MTRTLPRADTAFFAGLLALIVWLPLPWGSQGGVASALIGCGVAVLGLWWLGLQLRGLVAPPALSAAARAGIALGMAWMLWTGVQALPLPIEWLAYASPRSLETHRAVGDLLGVAPLYTLSVAPSATLEQWLLGASYFALYLVTLAAAQDSSRLRAILIAVAGAAAAQAVYGALMALSGLDYGFLAPKTVNLGKATGTFVNVNHLAAYLNLGMAAGLGAILAEGEPRDGSGGGWRIRAARLIDAVSSPRFILRFLLAVMVIALLLTRSRMGNAAFFTALLLAGGCWVALRNRRRFPREILLFASLLVIDTLIVGRWYGLEGVVTRLEATNLQQEDRLVLAEELLPLARAYQPAGAGLGAFAVAYARDQAAMRDHRVDHAHNEYLELLIETGVPGAAIALALALVHGVHALRVVARRRRPARVAAAFAGLMALLASGIQAAVDFQLRVPAVMGTLVVLCALVAASDVRSGRDPAPVAAE